MFCVPDNDIINGAMRILRPLFLSILFIFFIVTPVFGQTPGILSPEEDLWLKARNNTIVVYPEKNNPPYSYQSVSGNIQGLSIDYMELIADKIGTQIQYLTPRSRSQIINDTKEGKGDIALLHADLIKEEFLIFSESYITVPVVIVVRKDFDKNDGLTLNDFNGKRVAMIADSAIETYVKMNYPRVVREPTTDNEVGLQQVVLGEVDAAVMDVASLSFYLSKQVLSSVKIAGNTGFDYKPAFGLTKDKSILQSVLEKGLSQISISDRDLLADKWIVLPGENKENDGYFSSLAKAGINNHIIYVLLGLSILIIFILLKMGRSHRDRYFHKVHNIKDLKEEFSELENESNILTHELLEVKAEEEQLKEKLKSLSEGHE